ncbi:hypothetical protein CCYS_11975 [Corynebacterium cystitidis DSM 20524]|uniref:Uncharacterized protein n=1 Tax=Corynebacterium cystitidis DSM 20524 TaxID=1121357 RepID=A0A1H9W9A1_9CORY|nr:hypothetical protein CCYS_11975 [Corynebacterium cystitidis DSM 20524]SES30043.1 hypothetical protein SAMN05661109_02583 [Corynebacterium cystitidis DSM 20524]SNV63886.1 DNA integrity scanning protein DisA [Corynebacterium cystitidis]
MAPGTELRDGLDLANQRLFVAEMNNYATVSDVLSVLQRELLTKRAGFPFSSPSFGATMTTRLTCWSATTLSPPVYLQQRTSPTSLQPWTDCPTPSCSPQPPLRALNFPSTEEILVREIVPRC